MTPLRCKEWAIPRVRVRCRLKAACEKVSAKYQTGPLPEASMTGAETPARISSQLGILRGGHARSGGKRVATQREIGTASNAAATVTKATAGRIRHYLSDREQSVYTDLKGMCERVSDGYRERVVIELLQNAHDAHAKGTIDGAIALRLDPDEGPHGTLIVANGGRGFTAGNFKAICSPTMTTKSVNEAIGNKGVGFLSVFQVCAHPEIYSRSSGSPAPNFDGFCFAFADDRRVADFLGTIDADKDAPDVLQNMPRVYLACPIDGVPPVIQAFAEQGYATAVRLPLKNAESLKSVRKQLEALMAEEPPVQLFLSRIQTLDIRIEGSAPRAGTLGRDQRVLSEGPAFRLLEIGCGARRYLIAERTIPHDTIMAVIAADVEGERLPESWSKWEGDAIVSLAVVADGAPVSGRLFNFLPMGIDAAAPFAGYLDAPFYASIDRLKLQQSVDLNDYLIAQCHTLAVEGAIAIRDSLPAAAAKAPVIDMLLWDGSGRDGIRDSLVKRGHALIPTIKSKRTNEWTPAVDARLWPGDAFMTPAYAAQVGALPIVDPGIGTARLDRLRAFMSGSGHLIAKGEERAQVVESIARDLQAKASAIPRWNQFYRSLAAMFALEAPLLQGRPLLRTAVGELDETGGPRRKGSKARLSSTFLPPLRTAGAAAAVSIDKLPPAVRRRLGYVDPALEIASDGASAARRFLVNGNLVREHETREILRLLAAAIAEPGAVKDPEALRWAALNAMMEIVIGEDSSAATVADIPLLVPVRSGWRRATDAFFGSWNGTQGKDLESFFEEVAGVSAELDLLAENRLLPYRDWQVPPGRQDDWTNFLRKAGVADHLRPIPVFSGAPPRGEPYHLPTALTQRAGLGDEQSALWRTHMGEAGALPNPFTPYTARNVYRLPGQADWAAIAPVAGMAYAKQLILMIDASPDLAEMTVYRPSAHHSSARNERRWLSPVGAFLIGASWVPTSGKGQALLRHAWLPPIDARSTPPGLPVIDWDVRLLLGRCEQATKLLRKHGMPDFGFRATAWRFLTVAATLVDEAGDHASKERLLAAALDNWQNAPLDIAPPSDFRLIARQSGRVVSVDISDSEPPILIVDGENRQAASAVARAFPETLIFEPPSGKAPAIANYFDTHFPDRMKRASQLRTEYEVDGTALVFDPGDELAEDALGPVVREALILALRYKCSFYHAPAEDVLHRLSSLRLKWLPTLTARLGELSETVPLFASRAALLRTSEGQTLLVAESLRGSSSLLLAVAETLGEAVGSRKNIGEPFANLAAQLLAAGPSPTHADYAEILGLPLEEVQGVLGTASASTSAVRRLLLPFVYLYCGRDAAASFGPDGSLVTDEAIAAVLAALGEKLPLPASEVFARARIAPDVEALASEFDVDLAALNAILAALGPPYRVIDRTPLHQASLAAFLSRQQAAIRETLRQHFRSAWAELDDLTAYCVARGSTSVALPGGIGLSQLSVSQADMKSWLATWLADFGIERLAMLPRSRASIDAVRDANHKLLRSLVPLARVAARLRGSPELAARWKDTADVERRLVELSDIGGWADFDRLDASMALRWMAKNGWWDMKLGADISHEALGITEAEEAALHAADRREREEAAEHRQKVAHSGGTFVIGRDSYAGLVDDIAARTAGNAALLAASTRPMKGDGKFKLRAPGSGGGGGGGGPSQWPPANRKSEDERKLIGFFGEMIAFAWLKARYGDRRVIDESCWKSSYHTHVYGGSGNDGLGYDFEVNTGKHRWYFEVKATASSLADRHMIELGSTEVACAENCRADNRSHYRILFVTDALNPEQAQLFVLQNPRSREGLEFYTEQLSAGVRLHFPMQRARQKQG
jgi:hypothetical protein